MSYSTGVNNKNPKESLNSNLSHIDLHFFGTPCRICITTGVYVSLLLVTSSLIFSFSDSLAVDISDQSEDIPLWTKISRDQTTQMQPFQSRQLSQDQPNVMSYTNEQSGLTFSYPSEWFAQNIDDKDNDVEYIVLFAPYDSTKLEESRFDKDEYDTEVIVGSEDLYENGQSVGEFLDDMVESYEESKDGFEIVDSNSNFMVNGMPGYSLVYTTSDYMYMEVGTIMGDRNHWIEFSASPPDFNRHLSAANQIISSFGSGGHPQSNMLDNTNTQPDEIKDGNPASGDVGFGGTPVNPNEGESANAPIKPKF